MKQKQKSLVSGLCLLTLTSGMWAQGWNGNGADVQGGAAATAEQRPAGEGRPRGGRNMSEEERAAMRERWNNMSEEERAAMRERRMSSMSEEERAAMRERRNMREGGGAPAAPEAPEVQEAAEAPVAQEPVIISEPVGPRGGGRMGGGEGGQRGQRGPRGGGSLGGGGIGAGGGGTWGGAGGGAAGGGRGMRGGGGGMRGTRPGNDVLRAVNIPEKYQQLVTNSPFMSAEYRASLLSSANAGRRDLLFTGLSKPGGKWLFGLEERRQDRTYWMSVGESDNGIEILQFNETERTLSVSIDGREYILRFNVQ